MKNKKIKSFLLSCLVCLIPIGISLIFYNRLPSQVATHFDINGVPNGYSPKWFAAFGLPIFMMIINAIVWISLENDPKRKGINDKLKAVAKWMIPVLSLFVQSAIIAYALNNPINSMIQFTPLLVGIIFILIGNYLPKCKQNYTTGIRLPWTLNSEENWNKTHRLGGKLFVIGGILVAATSFYHINVAIFLSIIAMVSLIPVIYSFLLYKKGI